MGVEDVLGGGVGFEVVGAGVFRKLVAAISAPFNQHTSFSHKSDSEMVELTPSHSTPSPHTT